MAELKIMTERSPDLQLKREAHVARIYELLAAVDLTGAQFNAKINAQLQIDDGLDALGFVELEKVISWLVGKLKAKDRNAKTLET